MASRIEQLNKKYNTCILISEEVYNQLNNESKNVFIGIGSTRIKGSESPVSLYKFLKLEKS
jgi:class 3 adenylate cyclase